MATRLRHYRRGIRRRTSAPYLSRIRLEAEDSGQFPGGIPEGDDFNSIAENPSKRYGRFSIQMDRQVVTLPKPMHTHLNALFPRRSILNPMLLRDQKTTRGKNDGSR